MGARIFLILLFIVMQLGLAAQDHSVSERDQTHAHGESEEHGQMPKHEIGLGVSPTWAVGHSEVHAALHLQYLYNFSHTKFALGAEIERLFGEHRHNFGGIVLAYRPVHELALNIIPGWAFEEGHRDDKSFAMHFTATYSFKLGVIHLGPSFTAAYEPEDWQLSFGVHAGIGF